jgi:hypothetical protein
MRKILTIVLALFTIGIVYGQKTVIVTKYAKEVPEGKKWTLEANKMTKVQLNKGVLNSGTMCNALFRSSPRIIMNVNRGTIYKSEGYGIILKDPEKVPYTNDYTYEFTPISFVDKSFSLSELQYEKAENLGTNKIEFMAGETVFVASCLESIEMIETNMTKQELLAETKKQEEIKNTKLTKAKNFCIPINPEKYVEPDIKPELKDSLIQYVVFESPAVMFRSRNQRGGYDDVHQWTLTLTQSVFEMKSSNINETYTVLNAKYNEQLHFQEFQLADETGEFTHKLNICYSNSSKSYMVIFSSVDNKDDYQFQEITLKEIKFQNE